MIDMTEVEAIKQDVLKNPLDELIALATAMIYVGEKVVDGRQPEDLDPDLFNFLGEVTEVAELLLA